MMMINRNKYLAGLIFISFFSIAALFAQEPVPVTRSQNKVVLEGKVYYVHVVKAGQTLYSIARAYKVSEQEIIKENPGSSSNLGIGQVLKIPSDPINAFNEEKGNITQERNSHVIQPGETLYSVSRLHNCTVDEIMQINPGLEINDIPVGMVILLPSKDMVQNNSGDEDDRYILHEVKRGETLYSLARYYNVNIRDIREINDDMGRGVPRTGEFIRIPKTAPSLFEESVSETVMADTVRNDTLAEIVNEKYDYEEFMENDFFPRKRYRIAYLIPFDYSEMLPLDSLLKEVKSAARRERIKEDYLLEVSKPKSVNFLEFLEGSLMAVDSLSDSGAELDIKVFDTKKSMFRTRQILQNPEMADMDLIIGPFYEYNLALVSEFSKKHHIPLVTPFYSNDSLILDNPYLFQANPSIKTEYIHNAEYIGRFPGNNLLFVHSGDSSQIKNVNFYKHELFRELSKYADIDSVHFEEIIITDGNADSLVAALDPELKNLIILPGTDEAFASQLASRLYYERVNFDIEVFGSSYWIGFDDIEISYIHALKLKLSNNQWYDYTDTEFLNFLKSYRSNYTREPANYTRKGSSFAITGYDLSYYFISALKKYGPRFIMRVEDYQADATISEFRFEKVSRTGGFENRMMKYYYFDPDLEVKEIPLPENPNVQYFLKTADDYQFNYMHPVQELDSVELKDL